MFYPTLAISDESKGVIRIPLCILFSDTKGIQWVAANATH
jgi:hypothetical protein